MSNLPPMVETASQNGSQPFVREMRYNRLAKCLDMYLDGEYVGSRATSDQAEQYLNNLVYDRLSYNAERISMMRKPK
jgi:hypothetical protein